MDGKILHIPAVNEFQDPDKSVTSCTIWPWSRMWGSRYTDYMITYLNCSVYCVIQTSGQNYSTCFEIRMELVYMNLIFNKKLWSDISRKTTSIWTYWKSKYLNNICLRYYKLHRWRRSLQFCSQARPHSHSGTLVQWSCYTVGSSRGKYKSDNNVNVSKFILLVVFPNLKASSHQEW